MTAVRLPAMTEKDSARFVLGVDPGAAETGAVIRHGDTLIWHSTVKGDWRQVLDQLRAESLEARTLVAIEQVTAPNAWHNGQRRMLHPQQLIDTAAVAYAVAGWAYTHGTPVEWIPATHNGQGDPSMYPPELRPARGKGRGFDRLRHERSAWDVAGMAALLAAHEVTAHIKPGPPQRRGARADTFKRGVSLSAQPYASPRTGNPGGQPAP